MNFIIPENWKGNSDMSNSQKSRRNKKDPGVSGKKYYVYIVECRDNNLYIGSTCDLEKRLYAHNHLRSGARYTRGRRPVFLRYQEGFVDRSSALKKEAELKRLSRKEKLQIIAYYYKEK